jgi:hypothetical protein
MDDAGIQAHAARPAAAGAVVATGHLQRQWVRDLVATALPLIGLLDLDAAQRPPAPAQQDLLNRAQRGLNKKAQVFLGPAQITPASHSARGILDTKK